MGVRLYTHRALLLSVRRMRHLADQRFSLNSASVGLVPSPACSFRTAHGCYFWIFFNIPTSVLSAIKMLGSVIAP